MADMPSVEQAGSATVWFTTQAGITATVLAVFCIVLLVGIVWRERKHSAEMTALTAGHSQLVKALDASQKVTIEAITSEWGKRIDGFRQDIKDAFGENNAIADKVVEALMNVKLEIARMGGRSDNARR